MKIDAIKATQGDTLMKYRGGFFLLLVMSVLAASTAAPTAAFAAGSASGKLLGLKTAVDAQATTITLQLPSSVSFTPSQVSPKLYLLDLSGVSTDLSADSQRVQSPLVNSYRVFSYQGADSMPHVGVELTLKEEAEITPRKIAGGVQVRVMKSSARAGRTMPAPVSAAIPASQLASKVSVEPIEVSANTLVTLREVSVIQPENGEGLEVEIIADGAMTFKTMKLSNPDRLVLDLPNTINRIKQSELAVGTTPLQTVRIAQYKSKPPMARVVMDLDGKVTFDIRKEATGLVVALRSAAVGAVSQTSVTPLKAASVEPAAKTENTAKQTSETKIEHANSQPEPLLVASSNGAGVGAATAGDSHSSTPLAWHAEPMNAPAKAVVNASAKAQDVPANFAETVMKPAPAMAISVPGNTDSVAGEQSGLVLMAQRAAQPSVLMAQAAPARPAPAAASSAVRTPDYTGEPISLNLKDVDLKDFFRLMHEVSNLNIVLDPAVAGMVTIVLDEVPWDQAMDVVLRNNQLGKEVTGNVVRIAKLSTIEAEKRQQETLARASQQAEPTDTVTRTLSYARAADLITPLKRFLSARGDLVADPRTNTLIITDIAEAITRVDRLISGLDRKTQQVEIEARIVAASRSFARDIGSQLAASGLSGNVVLGGAGVVGASPVSRGTTPPLFIGTPPDPPAPGEAPKFANVAQPLAVNLGAVGATSGFSFLLSGGSNFALDAIITAAEGRGLGKLLSRPKIITQNNVEATVEQGVRIPIQTNVNNTIAVQYTDATLRLTVTPQITAEGTIFLKAEIENTSINDGIPRILGIPALNTQAANTEVLVSDGGTVFFGGIIQTTNALTEQEVPLLGSIPLVGNLFKRKFTRSQTDELLFFITPKIVQG